MTFRFNDEVLECTARTALELCYIAVLAQNVSGESPITSKANELERSIKQEIMRNGGIINE